MYKREYLAIVLITCLFYLGLSPQTSRLFITSECYIKDTASNGADNIDMIMTGDVYVSKIQAPAGLHFTANAYIDDDGGEIRYTSDGNHYFSGGAVNIDDNLTVDSIFSTRSAALESINIDDYALTITSSLMIINSDNGVATDRTIVLGNGSTVGQRLQIIYNLLSSNKAEIQSAGNVLTKDGATHTFDVDRENMKFVWDGTYWVEDGRDL